MLVLFCLDYPFKSKLFLRVFHPAEVLRLPSIPGREVLWFVKVAHEGLIVNWVRGVGLSCLSTQTGVVEGRISMGNSAVTKGISDNFLTLVIFHNSLLSGAVAASDIWGVLKYHEPVFIPNTLKKPCYFLFMLQGKEFRSLFNTHFYLVVHAQLIGLTTMCD